MEEGFIPDATYGQIRASHWHRGPGETQTLLGFDLGRKVDEAQMYPIVAFRCRDCWLVRSYAPQRAR
jgi:hypothetical protein